MTIPVPEKEEQVLTALLYYREHQAEIDAQDAADARQSLEMQRATARGHAMQFARHLRDGIRSGEITTTIRIWQSPRVKSHFIIENRITLNAGIIRVHRL